jgi:hypothetical protein
MMYTAAFGLPAANTEALNKMFAREQPVGAVQTKDTLSVSPLVQPDGSRGTIVSDPPVSQTPSALSYNSLLVAGAGLSASPSSLTSISIPQSKSTSGAPIHNTVGAAGNNSFRDSLFRSSITDGSSETDSCWLAIAAADLIMQSIHSMHAEVRFRTLLYRCSINEIPSFSLKCAVRSFFRRQYWYRSRYCSCWYSWPPRCIV